MKQINSTAPQVVVSAGGRFHAHKLANQLQKKSALKQLFTFDYNASDHNTVNAQFVTTITSCKIINDLFVRFQCSRFFDKARFNIFKDNLFDRIVAKKITSLGQFNLFVGWAHYSLHSITAAKKAGAKVIIESGSCHILEQKKLLDAEYSRWGIQSPSINQHVIDKMCKEYDQADYIMTLSSFARESFIKQGFSESKILMVPCGVDVEFFVGSSPIQPTPQLYTKDVIPGLIGDPEKFPTTQAWIPASAGMTHLLTKNRLRFATAPRYPVTSPLRNCFRRFTGS